MSFAENKNYEELYIQKCENFDNLEIQFEEFKGILITVPFFNIKNLLKRLINKSKPN